MNPYSKTYLTKDGDAVVGSAKLHRSNSSESLIGNNGEINASSKQDLMRGISELVTAMQKGEIREATKEDEMTAAEKKQMLATAAAAGTHSDEWSVIGSTMAAEVKETLGREGFARKFMQFRSMTNGEPAKIRLRKRDTLAWVTTTNPNTVASVARAPYAEPAMFSLTANINIEQTEIAQDTGDLLDDRYNDGLENMMVGEDKVFLKLADNASTCLNDPYYFSDFTPTTMQMMKMEVASNGGIPVTSMLISFDIWNDIVAQPEFTAWYSEIAKHELVMEGNLGSLAGMKIVTDGFRIPTLQVLPKGSVYMFGAPETLGVIFQWGDMSVKSVDKANDGRAVVGWFMNSVEAMGIGNARAVVRGNRV
jgi:hypothetical protein